MADKRLIIGMTGASGTPLAIHLLRVLHEMGGFETHLVATENALLTASYESDLPFDEIAALADVYHEGNPIDAPIASGTFSAEGMIVIPCSMKTVAGIANGFSDNLLLRAADVTLKEHRKLVLVARETPLSSVHLKNLAYLSTLPDIVILPPMMTYYIAPDNVADMEHHIVCKVLSQFGIDVSGFQRWGEGACPGD